MRRSKSYRWQELSLEFPGFSHAGLETCDSSSAVPLYEASRLFLIFYVTMREMPTDSS
jgi:hypothetical protein